MSEREPKHIVDRGKKARDAAPIQRLIAGFASEPHRPAIILETQDFEHFNLPPYDAGMDDTVVYRDPDARLDRIRNIDL